MSNVARIMQQLAKEARTSGLVITDTVGYPLSDTQEKHIGQDGSGFGILDTEIKRTDPGSWWRFRRPRVRCAVIATVTRRGGCVYVTTTNKYASVVSRLLVYVDCADAQLNPAAVQMQIHQTHWWGQMPRR